MIRHGRTIEQLTGSLVHHGKEVKVGDWQALDVRGTAVEETHELLNCILEVDIPPTMDELQELTKPDLPWAEDHFQERVSGEPLNPGYQYMNWPWYAGKEGKGVEEHRKGGVFSHTYMERYWPKHAMTHHHVPGTGSGVNQGIRYPYGDLNDLVAQLARSPYTRQAYLPIFFPEDTGAVHGERVPCTLGYHFILRENRLHCVYYIRSCDAVRHFRNDVYMTCRLVQWVLDRVRQITTMRGEKEFMAWDVVTPGTLTMHITSFHCFKGDMPKLRREYA